MIPQQFLEMAQAYRLLAGLPPAVLRQLLPLAVEKHFDAGQPIFREGDRSLYLHLIVSGSVALEMMTGEGSMIVQTLHTGDAMGWSALTVDSVTHFQALALTRVVTIAFRGDELRKACERDPAIGYPLMKALLDLVTDRLDAARLQLINTSSRSATPL